jgi:hypothetical protein
VLSRVLQPQPARVNLGAPSDMASLNLNQPAAVPTFNAHANVGAGYAYGASSNGFGGFPGAYSNMAALYGAYGTPAYEATFGGSRMGASDMPTSAGYACMPNRMGYGGGFGAFGAAGGGCGAPVGFGAQATGDFINRERDFIPR